NTLHSSGTTPTPYQYVGAYGYFTEPLPNLMLLWHRWYDAGTGRFGSRDPIARQGVGAYRYVWDAPTGLVDAGGLALTAPDRVSPAPWLDTTWPGRLLQGDTWYAGWQGFLQFGDLLIPFWDPSADAGVYDRCDPAMRAGAIPAEIAAYLTWLVGGEWAFGELAAWLKTTRGINISPWIADFQRHAPHRGPHDYPHWQIIIRTLNRKRPWSWRLRVPSWWPF
ncbi:MAG: RHS repeat-associated core domain-containing protein, partial [Armatimonadia bacterium]